MTLRWYDYAPVLPVNVSRTYFWTRLEGTREKFGVWGRDYVSAAATSVFQLEHMPRMLHSECPEGYWIRTIEYGKILVMLVYGEYYGRVYEVYNIYILYISWQP